MFQKHQIQIRACQVHQQKKNINWINERFRKQLKRKSKKKRKKERKLSKEQKAGTSGTKVSRKTTWNNGISR